MTYAHITADTINALGNPPDLEWDGTRWWDLRDPTIRQARGWHEVTETPRPDPIDGGVHESTVELVDGLPVRVWTWRAWTAEEIAAQVETEQQQARYQTHEAILDATAALMQQAHNDGAAWVQPTGAHDAVPFGRTVTKDGKEWRSKHHANVWEPSASSPWWEEVIVGGTGPQPWALDVYYTPPTKVTFEDNAYECTFEHLSQVGWEPNNPTMYSVWKLIQAP